MRLAGIYSNTVVLSCVVPLLALSGCTHSSTRPLMSSDSVLALVAELPESQEKSIALAIVNNDKSRYRVDHNGYPAWSWRGKDDIGGCVHIDPKTKKPYLENQYPRRLRTDVPKYIDFQTDTKDWQCRIHHFFLGRETERNWSSPKCHKDGKALLNLLETALKKG